MIDSRSPPSLRRPPATILVVEDDAAMRELVADTLRRDGYLVFAVSSASEAVGMLNPSIHIDLVLTDLRMAGLSGLELGARVRELRGSTPLILMTAFPEPDVDDAAADIGAQVIAKPFRLEVLRRTVLTTIAAAMRATS